MKVQLILEVILRLTSPIPPLSPSPPPPSLVIHIPLFPRLPILPLLRCGISRYDKKTDKPCATGRAEQQA